MRHRIWRRHERKQPAPLEYRSGEEDRKEREPDPLSQCVLGIGKFLLGLILEGIALIAGIVLIIYLRGCWVNA